ncbi:hypothetical protein [Capnocytophaga sp. oral taxon 878]|nr:hypothetical protein [Capnocytophaga sp. oral taxon 878]
MKKNSKATCPIGGKDCINIINHGQVSEITNRHNHIKTKNGYNLF